MKNLCLFFITIIVVYSCKKEKADEVLPAVNDTCSLTITYTSQIQSIINTNCAISGCHVSPNPTGGVDFTTYAGVKAKVDDDRIKARAIDGNPGFMPPSGRLPDSTIKILNCWIKTGAKQ